MTLNLPTEIWLNIFSYLELEELAKARGVCKSWWEIINTDILWKPLLLERKITHDSIKRKTDDAKDDESSNCSWANLCFSYYNNLCPKWKNMQYTHSKYPRFTADVVIKMPYIVRTFDPRHLSFVEVLRHVNGEFVVNSRLPLPDDGFEECYEPQMTTDDVFAVIKNNTTIIFKRKDDVFQFSKALHMTTNETFISCSDVNGLSKFMLKKEDVFANLACGVVTKSVIWFLDSFSKNVYVWNYMKSELLLKWSVPCFDKKNVRIQSSDKFVFVSHLKMLTIFSLHGERLWHCAGTTVLSLSWNNLDCGFIQGMGDDKFRIVSLAIPKLTTTNIYIEEDYPVALTLHKTDRLAYCVNAFESTLRILTVSLATGAILWDTVICKSFQPICSIMKTRIAFFIEMNIILGKYITIYGVDGESNDLCSSFVNPGMLSLYSITDGEFICSESFDPYTILYMEDQLILAGKSTNHSSRKYKYELYSLQS